MKKIGVSFHILSNRSKCLCSTEYTSAVSDRGYNTPHLEIGSRRPCSRGRDPGPHFRAVSDRGYNASHLEIGSRRPCSRGRRPRSSFPRSATADTTPHTLKLAPVNPVAGVVDPGPRFRGHRPRLQATVYRSLITAYRLYPPLPYQPRSSWRYRLISSVWGVSGSRDKYFRRWNAAVVRCFFL